MRERDLRPCDLCGKPLTTGPDGQPSPIEAGARAKIKAEARVAKAGYALEHAKEEHAEASAAAQEAARVFAELVT